MFLTVMITTTFSMLLGALGFALLNRKSQKLKSRERNLKLLTYIIIIWGIYIAMAFSLIALYILASVLVIIALREILSISYQSGKNPLIALIVSLPVFYFFAQFIRDTSMPLQLFTYFIVVHFDGFSQVSGELFGKHKMLPVVSPAKTWEGLIGGCFVVFILSFVVYKFTNLGRNWGETLLLSGILVLASLLGDILASWYKRICAVKDYSNLIPGHGGVLDRFDSFFMAGAVIQLLQNFYSP